MSAASQQVEQMKNAVDGLFKELSLDPATLIAQLDSTYPVALAAPSESRRVTSASGRRTRNCASAFTPTTSTSMRTSRS
jgi:hypothetical protein